MTEKREPYVIGALTESEIQSAVVEALRKSGWEVTVTSQDKSTRRHLAGLPDLVAVRSDHILFIECKTAKGELRPSQREWHDRHMIHLGAHVQCIVVRNPTDIVGWVGWGHEWMSGR